MKRIPYFFTLFCLSGLITLTYSPCALAASSIWNQTIPGMWNVSENWNGGLPTYNDEVYINNGGTVALPSGVSGTYYRLFAGDNAGNSANILISGGTLSGTSAILGRLAGSQASALITGGTWSSFYHTIGALGTGSMVIAGGSVTNSLTYIGDSSGGNGTVTVTSGTLASTAAIMIGESGTGSLLINGGLVDNSGNARIGGSMGGNGLVTVTSGTWHNSDILSIGGSGGKGTLIINGGYMDNAGGYIGQSIGSTGNVTVSSGTWRNRSYLYMSNGSIMINGGFVYSVGTDIGSSVGSTSTVTVSGGTWLNGPLTIGEHGSGTVLINGGYVTNSRGNIGEFAAASGTVTVTSGTWNNSSTLVIGGSGRATLNIDGGAVTVSSTLTIAASANSKATLNLNNGGLLEVGGGTNGLVTGSGTASINFAGGTLRVIESHFTSAVNATLSNTSTIDTNTFNATFSGTLSGQGALAKIGSGTISLSGSNTYTGGTIISGGAVNFSSAGSVGSGTVSLSSGTLRWAAGNTTDISARLILGSGTNGLDTATNHVTLATAFSGEGGLNKIGSGTLTLVGNNSYTGGTILSAGVLSFASGSNLGTGPIALSGGTLQWAPETASDISSRLTLIAATNRLDTNGNNVTLAHSITGVGGITKIGSGALTLSGANSYTGRTTVGAGVLSASNVVVEDGVSHLGNASSSVILGGIGTTGTFSYTGEDSSYVRGFTISSGGGELVVTQSTSTLLVETGDIFTSGKFAVGGTGNITITSMVSGSGSLTKIGRGVMVLGGSNTYTGTTTISEGTLKISNTNGSAFGSGAVILRSGATLTGAGSFTGTLTVQGALRPGNSPGSLTSGSEIWTGEGSYIWEINDASGTPGLDPGWDVIDIIGSLDITSTMGDPFVIDITTLTLGNLAGQAVNFDAQEDYTWTIVTTTTGITGFSADKFALNTSAFHNLHNGTFTIGLSENGNEMSISYTAVPEPSTYALILLSLIVGQLVGVHARRKLRGNRHAAM